MSFLAKIFESRLADRTARLQDINNAIFDPENSNLLKLRPDLTTDQLLDQASKLRSSIVANRNLANIVDKTGSFLDWAVRNGVKVGSGAAAGGITAATVGGMGLSALGGAVALGAAPVIAAGAIVGLATYGIIELFS